MASSRVVGTSFGAFGHGGQVEAGADEEVRMGEGPVGVVDDPVALGLSDLFDVVFAHVLSGQLERRRGSWLVGASEENERGCPGGDPAGEGCVGLGAFHRVAFS